MHQRRRRAGQLRGRRRGPGGRVVGRGVGGPGGLRSLTDLRRRHLLLHPAHARPAPGRAARARGPERDRPRDGRHERPAARTHHGLVRLLLQRHRGSPPVQDRRLVLPVQRGGRHRARSHADLRPLALSVGSLHPGAAQPRPHAPPPCRAPRPVDRARRTRRRTRRLLVGAVPRHPARRFRRPPPAGPRDLPRTGGVDRRRLAGHRQGRHGGARHGAAPAAARRRTGRASSALLPRDRVDHAAGPPSQGRPRRASWPYSATRTAHPACWTG